MAKYKLIIPGRFPGLNEYTASNRSNPYRGAKMKHNTQATAELYIAQQLRCVKITRPVYLNYIFYEKDRRRDKDNISAIAHKVIQDALVACGVLKNDGWGEIAGYNDEFQVDAKAPRIEITIEEADT